MGNDGGRTKKENVSRNYADPSIAAKQRELVDKQLADMREDNAPQHFVVVGDILKYIWREEKYGPFTLLDAGCGSAYYREIIEYYVADVIKYTGCDYNPGMVALTKERYPDLPIFQADVRNLKDFKDGQFDIVLSGALIIHVRDWRVALKELTRVARKWLVLHRTYVHQDGTPTTREKKDAYGQQVWYQTFNEDELLKQVRKLGFDLLDTYPTGEGIQHGAVKTYLFKEKGV